MRGDDFVQNLTCNRSVAYFSCHNVHGTENEAQLRTPPSETCVARHEEHAHHGGPCGQGDSADSGRSEASEGPRPLARR